MEHTGQIDHPLGRARFVDHQEQPHRQRHLQGGPARPAALMLDLGGHPRTPPKVTARSAPPSPAPSRLPAGQPHVAGASPANAAGHGRRPAPASCPRPRTAFVGIARNQKTHQPIPYIVWLPRTRSPQRPVFVIDPMLASRGSIQGADRPARQAQGRATSRRFCVLHHPRRHRPPARDRLPVQVVTASVDERLKQLGLHRARPRRRRRPPLQPSLTPGAEQGAPGSALVVRAGRQEPAQLQRRPAVHQ